jgi:hypothetical protein
MLDDYKHYPGLSVHWVFVGPSGMDERPAAGGALRHYKHCSGMGAKHIKTIANTFFLQNVTPHPHNFEFRYGHVAPVHGSMSPSPQSPLTASCERHHQPRLQARSAAWCSAACMVPRRQARCAAQGPADCGRGASAAASRQGDLCER